MSVVIKGMNVPKCCAECRFAEEESLEWFTCYVQDCSLPNANRYVVDSNCPLVELPEKHGRLIDADELWKKMSKYTDNMGAKMPFGDDDSMIHRDSACFIIESADTIIEAEGANE